MSYLPENRILRFLVISTTIAVVVCYAWLAAHLLEPEFSAPTFVSEAFIREPDSRLFLFDDQFRSYPRETERLNIELANLEAPLKWIGPFARPIEIIVDEKQVDRLLVTDSRLEIGRDVLLARGQLQKAVLKSWLLQGAGTVVTASHLRLEVASDVLLAMMSGGLSLEVPGFDEPIEFNEPKAWFTYADSYAGVCSSPWRSLELSSLCANPSVKSEAINVSELSFREFIGARIWTSFQAVPLKKRLAFVQRWTHELRNSRTVEIPNLREGWLAVINGELEALFPSSMDPLLNDRRQWSPRVDAPLIVIDEKGRITAPGTLKVVANTLPIAHARLGIMTACVPPKLADVLAVQAPVDRIVWKPTCKRADFVQVRPSAIRLALQRGLAFAAEPLDQFVLRKSPWFGVADAKWDSRLKAYQVHGAIQAVDTFRLETAASKN